MCDRLLYSSDMISCPLHRRQIHGLRAAAWRQLGGYGAQQRWVPSSCHSWAAGLVPVPTLLCNVSSGYEQLPQGNGAPQAQENGVAKYFIFQLWDKDHGNFQYYCPWHFLNAERDFSCYKKTFISAFPGCLCTSFPKCFPTFFSCLCLKFLQHGTHTKHAPGKKTTLQNSACPVPG